jgi:hypothetical protein
MLLDMSQPAATAAAAAAAVQILGRCVASANSPLDTVRKGVQQWLDLGVPPHKLVLGLPWYGEGLDTHPLHRLDTLGSVVACKAVVHPLCVYTTPRAHYC